MSQIKSHGIQPYRYLVKQIVESGREKEITGRRSREEQGGDRERSKEEEEEEEREREGEAILFWPKADTELHGKTLVWLHAGLPPRVAKQCILSRLQCYFVSYIF